MPGKTGFDMLAELERAPHVIFTTAYDEYALKAFEVNALDYLMKPIKPKSTERGGICIQPNFWILWPPSSGGDAPRSAV